MIRGLPYKTKQFFFGLIKLSIVVGAFYYCVTKLTENPDLRLEVFITFLEDKNTFTLFNIGVLLALTLLNWAFEIWKWQTLTSFISKITFYEALKQSLASLTASMITPNRIGDYAAKVVFYKRALRAKVLLLNLFSNSYQMSVTVLFGVTGLLFFLQYYELDIPLLKLLRFATIVFVLGFLTLFGLHKKGVSIRGFSMRRLQNFMAQIPRTIHVKTFLFAVIRYALFSFQFYFLLTLFGVEVPYFRAMMVITSMYLLASLIPTFFILDVVVKGSIAVYLFDIVGVNTLTTLCIITTMWLLNFVVPSIVGSFFVLKFSYSQAFPKNQEQ